MHILLIHQFFTPPEEPGGTRHYELASHLARNGHLVTIVTGDINYQTGKHRTLKDNPASAPYPVGMRLIRAHSLPILHRSFLWRVIAFMIFMVTSIWTGLRVRHVDLVMGTSPSLFQGVSAWTVAALKNRPFLLEIRDLWPEFAIDMGVLKNPFLIALSRYLERFLYRRATHLLVNSPAYRDYLIEKGIQEEKVTLIANGVDPGMFPTRLYGSRMRSLLSLESKFVVVYAGALGPCE